MGEFLTRAYREGVLVQEGFPVSEISECLEQPDVILWADLCTPSTEQLDELAGELGLHELAVEDAVSEHQRPKVDRYGTHLFLSCHAVEMDMEAGVLRDIDIAAFVTDRYLITVRKSPDFSMEPVMKRWDRSPELAKHGVGFLLYGLIDVVVDGYFDTIEQFDDYYEEVSDNLFSDRPVELAKQQHWFHMRKALVRFHKLAVPMRELVSSLMRRDTKGVPDEVYPYFQDVYDHILRVTESTDSLRDLVSTIVETNLSLRDYRQNQIVKKVGSWAAIAALPTLITGYFGMNVPYPGSQHWSGFLMSTVLLVVSPVVLYRVFRKKDWL